MTKGFTMKKSLIAMAALSALMAGCSTTSTNVNKFPLEISEEVCRELPGDIVNGYEFAWRITDEESILYSGRQIGLLPEQGGQPVVFELNKKTPYLKQMDVSKKDKNVVKSSLIMGDIETGIKLNIEINEDKSGFFNYSLVQSHVSEIRLIGVDDNYVEGPAVVEHKTKGSAAFDDKIDGRYGEVNRSALQVLFSGETIEESDRPFRFEMVACPIMTTGSGNVKIK